MSRYWVIAPYDATKHDIWENIWQFDLDNNCISIGWGNLGDVSQYDKDKLRKIIEEAYPERKANIKTRYVNTIWDFFHSIQPGDIIISRKGTKCIAAVGVVTKPGYFSEEKNATANNPEDVHHFFLDVRWLEVPKSKYFDEAVFGINTIYSISKTKFRDFIGAALYLNGVFNSVLQEILAVQKERPNFICYLQPYKGQKIVFLAEARPTLEKPIQLYISTSNNLEQISYRAKIVGWEDKQLLTTQRLTELNEHIQRFQPGEEKIYQTYEGKTVKNLISIIALEHLPNPFPVSNLIKVSDGAPYKIRSQSGGWASVFDLPEWSGLLPSYADIESKFEEQVQEAKKLSPQERENQLKDTPRFPEKVQVISIAYRRNPNVVAEVLSRANGKCEHCKNKAPFLRKSDHTPYLEVHHVVPLAEGGEDTIKNAIAVCPNCHRELHFGEPKE